MVAKFASFYSVAHFACQGYEGFHPEFRSLVWQSFELLPDPEHYCNTKFSNYTVGAIYEEISK